MPERKIFVGSSQEARDDGSIDHIIKCLEDRLPPQTVVKPWWETEWLNLESALRSLQDNVRDYDYAIFFAHPDDRVNVRGKDQYATRDNVIFEFGLFLTYLGTDRTFFVRPDEADPPFRIITDVGSSLTTPRFQFEVSGSKVAIDFGSLSTAAEQMASLITADIGRRMRERDDLEAATRRFKAELKTYDGTVDTLVANRASDTRLLNVAAEHIRTLLASKAAATSRDVKDAIKDLYVYFDLVDDLLNIGQLAGKQRTSDARPLKEVWVFSDDPLEFSSIGGDIGKQLLLLRKTVVHNLEQDVKYLYFMSQYPDPDVDQKTNRLLSWGTPNDKLGNVGFVCVDRLAFKTYFTVHAYRDNTSEIYMSVIMEGRDDLLVKVSARHAERIHGRLKSMIGSNLHKNDAGVILRKFVYDGR